MDEKAAGRPLWNKLHEIFGLDLRTLALFRVLMGILLLGELAARLPDARAFYTDDGMVPRSILPTDLPVSVYLFNGSLAYVLTLFAIQAGFAVMLLVGWQTTLATVVSWFLLISLQGRNVAIMHNGDVFLRMSLFFAIFLPLGAVWSIDSKFRRRPPGVGPLFLNAGTIAYVLQICFVYWFAVVWKSEPEWRSEFTAVHYALSVESLASPVAVFLRQFPWLTSALTVATMLIEAGGPLLVLFPFATQWLRLVAVVLFIGLHAGFGTCLVLGNFAPVCWVGWIALLPPLFWALLGRWCRTPARTGLVLHTTRGPHEAGGLDGLLHFLLLPDVLRIEPKERQPAAAGPFGWWLTDGSTGQELTGAEALRRLVWRSPLWWPLAWMPASILAWLAHWCGRPAGPGPVEAPYRSRYLAPFQGPALAFVALFCMLYIFAWNLRTVTNERVEGVFPRQLNTFGVALSLDQSWGVFAPSPGKGHGWYVLAATLRDGSVLDLVSGGVPDLTRKPEYVYVGYVNSRWRRVMMNFTNPSYSSLLPYYADWLRREWDRTHPGNEMLALEVWFVPQETTLTGYKTLPPNLLYRMSVPTPDEPGP